MPSQPVNRNRPGFVLGSRDLSQLAGGRSHRNTPVLFRVQTCKAARRRITVRRRTKAVLTLAAMFGTAVALAGPASANPYPPPSIHLLCSAAPTDGTVEGTVCVLPFGITTAPNAYSATIAVSKAGAAGATVTFALSAGSLPPGLTMPAQSGSAPPSPETPPRTGRSSSPSRRPTEPDLHDGLPDHRHGARPAGPVAVQRRHWQLPHQRDLRAA